MFFIVLMTLITAGPGQQKIIRTDWSNQSTDSGTMALSMYEREARRRHQLVKTPETCA